MTSRQRDIKREKETDKETQRQGDRDQKIEINRKGQTDRGTK